MTKLRSNERRKFSTKTFNIFLSNPNHKTNQIRQDSAQYFFGFFD